MSPRATLGGIRLMRRIDQYAGPPLCLALQALRHGARRLGLGRRQPAAAGGAPRRILVIKFWGLGSITLTTPALRALKRSFPDAELTFLTFAQNAALCRLLDAIDRVEVYDAGDVRAFVRSAARLLRFLRRERFDAVVDLEFYANCTSLLTGLAGAPRSVGFRSPKFWREAFYTERVPYTPAHITDNFLRAVAALGAEPDGDGLDAPRAGALAGAALDRLLPADGGPLICVNVNASPLDFKRRWPLTAYRELIARILAHDAASRVVLIGAPEERDYVARLTAALPAGPRLLDLSGRLTLEQLVALLGRSALFIGNDSGPLHLAVAAGVPTVSFFGPETPARYGPRGTGHAVLYKGLPCSPCLNVINSKDNSFCRDNVCLRSITVDEAWAAVRAQMQNLTAETRSRDVLRASASAQ